VQVRVHEQTIVTLIEENFEVIDKTMEVLAMVHPSLH